MDPIVLGCTVNVHLSEKEAALLANIVESKSNRAGRNVKRRSFPPGCSGLRSLSPNLDSLELGTIRCTPFFGSSEMEYNALLPISSSSKNENYAHSSILGSSKSSKTVVIHFRSPKKRSTTLVLGFRTLKNFGTSMFLRFPGLGSPTFRVYVPSEVFGRGVQRVVRKTLVLFDHISRFP